MNRFSTSIVALLAVFVLSAARPAVAGFTFTVDGVSVTGDAGVAINPGAENSSTLDLTVALASAPQSFTLDTVGQSETFEVATIKFFSQENDINSTEIDDVDLFVTVTFSDPVSTTTAALTLVGSPTPGPVNDPSAPTAIDYQAVYNIAPQTIAFGNGGEFTLAFEPLTLTGKGPQILNGIVTLTVAPVPEPAMFALFGLGGMGAAFVGYRRRKNAA